MSQENVKIARGMLDAWNREDFEGLAAPAHPEIEWSSGVLRQMEGTDNVYRGRAGLRRYWDEWHALWDIDIQLTETRDLGDTVLALALVKTTGKGSGVEVERRIGYVFEFEDRVVRRIRAYLSPAQALKAVGCRSNRSNFD